MISCRYKLQEYSLFRVLSLLQSNFYLTQTEVAEMLGLSADGLCYFLRSLIYKGLVKVQNFGQSKNKFVCIYVLICQGLTIKAALTGRFLQHKLAEINALGAEANARKDLEAKATSN